MQLSCKGELKPLENLNFLPPRIEKKYILQKMQTYKIAVLVLWICCLILFVIYMFFYNKNKDLRKEIIYNNDLAKTVATNNLPSKKTVSINTLKRLISEIENGLPYKALSIDDKKAEIKLVVEKKEQYYEIINLVENKVGFKILYLSTLYDNNGLFEFKMLVEVT